MTPYLAVFRARFQALLQYRAAAVAGVATQVFWGFIRIMILAACVRAGAGASPMSLEEVVTYVWLGQAMLLLLPWRAEPEVEDLIRTGDVAYELVRPLRLYRLWYARAVAARAAPTLLRSVPMVVLALLFFGMRPPASLPSLLAFLAALAAALALASAITTLLTVTLLWTVSGRGVAAVTAAFVWIFSGMTIPLPLFPDWAQGVLALLPFRGLMDAPFRLYLGHIPWTGAFAVLAHQAAWTLLFLVLGRRLLARGARRLVVQGG